jgi:gag-polyprotein putative aspartyl protease
LQSTLYFQTSVLQLSPQARQDRSKFLFVPFCIGSGHGEAFVDSGCTFNAISTAFANKWNIPFDTMHDMITIKIGGEQDMAVPRRIAQVTINLGSLGTLDTHVFVLDVLPMHAEAIFGMDFLKTVNPSINWAMRTTAISKNETNFMHIMEDEINFQYHMHVHRVKPYKGETSVISTDEYEKELGRADAGENMFFILNPLDTEKAQRFKSQGWC